MCGIVGIVATRSVSDDLMDGLKRLEYRGYDSAGIATLEQGEITRSRAKGKIANLEHALEDAAHDGAIGIAHTRWATHGAPIAENAHPHATEKVAVVHNGIIENFRELRKALESDGYTLETETDTEVIPLLITHCLLQGQGKLEAVQSTVNRLEGAYALGIMFAGDDETLIAVRQGSPLAVGYGVEKREGELYLGSDAMALAAMTNHLTYLQDGDVALLQRGKPVRFFDASGHEVKRDRVIASASTLSIGKENYRHFMLKEIYEQPSVIGDVFRAYLNAVQGEINLPNLPFALEEVSRLTIVACGTSYYAGFIAKYWAEEAAQVPVDIDVASEFRYRNSLLGAKPGDAALFISQSGETADTLAAMRYAKSKGLKTIAIVNVTESTMAREADAVLPIYCGPEIGVASTKAFTAQLATLACFIIALGKARGLLEARDVRQFTHSLSEIPSRMAEVLNHDEAIKNLAQDVVHARDILYIGRGISYGLALEGALKLKEISYIHAEAAAAGELKHGPIALVDEEVPVVCIAPADHLFEKTASNIREVAARGGRMIVLSDEKGVESLDDVTEEAIILPDAAPFVTPILYAIPIQLLAYHVAVAKGTDVDQPRNLAKSVTVE